MRTAGCTGPHSRFPDARDQASLPWGARTLTTTRCPNRARVHRPIRARVHRPIRSAACGSPIRHPARCPCRGSSWSSRNPNWSWSRTTSSTSPIRNCRTRRCRNSCSVTAWSSTSPILRPNSRSRSTWSPHWRQGRRRRGVPMSKRRRREHCESGSAWRLWPFESCVHQTVRFGADTMHSGSGCDRRMT